MRKPSNPMFDFTAKEYKRFWNFVEVSGDCWLWTGCQRATYGAFQVRGKARRAHRWIFQVINQIELPAAEKVCHKCDVRLCVRPSHLFQGSTQANHFDALRKGKKTGRTKLTQEQANYIRERYLDGEKSKHLSRLFGVGQSHCARISDGTFWG